MEQRPLVGWLDGQQLNPLHPLLHKLHHRGWIAEVELAGGAEHHHPPALDAWLLLHQAGGFGIEPPQETGIGGHLGLKNQRWQIGPLWRGQEQPIEPVFALFQHRG